MRMLVTGANGFIGSHLVEYLADNGHTVREFDKAFGEDVADLSMVENAFEDVDGVFHLAAVADVWNDDKSDLYDANIRGVKNIASVAEKTDTPTVFTSSVTARNPTNLYAESKEIGEKILSSYDGPISWVRLSNVIGPKTEKGQVAAMVEQAVTTGEIEVWGNGNIRRSYVSVARVCDVLYDILRSDSTGFVREVGSQTMTNAEMAEMIANRVNDNISISLVSKMPPSPTELVVSDIDEESICESLNQMIQFHEEQEN